MLRMGEGYAILVAPGIPPITIEILNDKQIAVDGALIEGISFDQAIKMIEESAQANLNQAVTILIRKLSWEAKEIIDEQL